MSTTRNIDSINEKQGQFQPAIERTAPQTTKGHQLGTKTSPNDYAPEFHAQTLPPGTAPAGSSYTPNPVNETPSQALNPDVMRSHGKESTYVPPSETIQGATSKDVHTGLGKPLQGQTATEVYHDGKHGRKRDTYGYEGVGASGHPKHQEGSIGDSQKVSDRYMVEQRGIERDEAQPGRHGDKGSLAAEDMRPEPAETVARERA